MPVKKEHVIYTGGQFFSVGVTFLFNLLVAKLLGKEQMGIWQLANLISVYGIVFTLGIPYGMSQEIPILLGRGAGQRVVSKVMGTTLTLLMGLVSVLLLAGLLFLSLEPDEALVLGLGLILLAARLLNAFSIMLIRSHQEFLRLGLHQAISAFLLCLGALWVWRAPDLNTVLVVVCLSLVLCGALASRHLRFSPYSSPVVARLVKVGMPIMMIGIIYNLLTTVDRVLIAGLLGTRELGLYSPVISMLGAITVFPGLVSNVMYPRMGYAFGQTGSHQTLVPMVRQVIRLNYAITLPLSAAIGLLFYFVIVPDFLHEYEECLVPLAIALMTALFMPLGLGLGDFLVVVGRQRAYLVNMVVGMAVNCCAGYLFVSNMNLGLAGIALGSVVGMAAYAILQYLTYVNYVRTSG